MASNSSILLLTFLLQYDFTNSSSSIPFRGLPLALVVADLGATRAQIRPQPGAPHRLRQPPGHPPTGLAVQLSKHGHSKGLMV